MTDRTPSSPLQPGWRETRKSVGGVSLHLVEPGDPGGAPGGARA